MSYRVVLTTRAKKDLTQAFLRAAEHAPQTAVRWLDRFQLALQTLSNNPQRCTLAPENELVEFEVRQFLFGRGRNVYRALFTTRSAEVYVLHVRWGGREFALPDELAE